MPYGCSQEEIEKRLNELVRLVRAGRHSTPTLALALAHLAADGFPLSNRPA